ncbi:hypothetical protein BX600DRAFT_544401 [Xylariales sp. PMI_506]|nr:hypothetical protein BX600DRAFT_544401 [Xylariales sp. PMI_506]
MLRSGRVPAIAALAVIGGGGVLWQSMGSKKHENSRNASGASETLQKVAGTGGGTSKDAATEDPSQKDTKLYSRDPSAASKRNPDKSTDSEKVGSGVSGVYGKHIGGESEMPWKDLKGRKE